MCMCGAQVDKRLSNMKLHGSVVPHKQDIDELRDTSKKEVSQYIYRSIDRSIDLSIYLNKGH